MNDRKSYPKEWKQFEEAVAVFLKALSPDSTVKHNIYEKDRHSGRRRQRDIIVETTLLNQFPIKILISCKRIMKKLNQNDIDTFLGNLHSSEAAFGMIYSYSGFTKYAIEKAENIGTICCCNLYENRPPEIPQVIIMSSYCCIPRISFEVHGDIDERSKLKTYNDLFFQDIINAKGKKIIDVLSEKYHEATEELRKKATDKPFLMDWKVPIGCFNDDFSNIELIYIISWEIYRGKIDAYLIKGSYIYGKNIFIGQQKSPDIDLHGLTPGPGWELIPRDKINTESTNMVVMLYPSDIREGLLKSFRKRKLLISS